MTIDWAHFTLLAALGGGALIGLAGAFLVLGGGRVLGAAGIFGGAVEARQGLAWRWSLIAGLLLAPTLARAVWGAAPPLFAMTPLSFAAAGLLVGFGARLGAGCTSGHGVCGVARLSPRSFVATALFMASAFATVFVARHVLI